MILRKLVCIGLVLVFCQAASAAQPADKPHRSSDEIRAEIDKLQAELQQATAAENENKSFIEKCASKLNHMLPITMAAWIWFIIGFGGEFVFFLRFVVQWIASEKKKRTVVPMAFWHLSLAGTVLVLAYAVYRIDPVFILAYSLNVVIYIRNMYIARRNPADKLLAEKTSE